MKPNKSIFIIFFIIIFINFSVCFAKINKYFVKNIQIKKSPLRLIIYLNKKSPYKIVQIDKKEVLIALKNAKINKTFYDKYKILNINELPDNVLAMVINPKVNIKNVHSKWIENKKILLITFVEEVKKKKIKKKVKKKEIKEDKIEKTIEQDLEKTKTKVLKLDQSQRNKIKLTNGNFDDILIKMNASKWYSDEVKESYINCKVKNWERAYSLANDYIENNKFGRSLKKAYFLRAYAYYYLNENKKNNYLDVIDLLQDAINYYSKSSYVPYAMAIIGNINYKLANYPLAKGYYTAILKKYKRYKGTPEIFFKLGLIFIMEKKYDIASSFFNRIIKNYKNTRYAVPAQLEIGKVFFELSNYKSSLDVFQSIIKKDPQALYKYKSLMLYIGNCYYEFGKYEKARDILMRAYNYFPDRKENDILLTKIGDSYNDEKYYENAKKIYELVITKYPKTDGFIISSIRMASFVQSRSEQENIYYMLIKGYPDNSMSKFAMLRLANLYYKASQFKKGIEILRNFLKKKNPILDKQALHLLEESYKSLFKKLQKAKDYVEMLIWYKKDKDLFDRLESPFLFQEIGNAYYNSFLYKKAADNFVTSYKLYPKNKRNSQLLFELASSLYQINHQRKALKIYEDYIKLFPKESNIIEVYINTFNILLKFNKNAKAIKTLEKAYKRTNHNYQKAWILFEETKYYNKLKKYDKSIIKIKNAIALLSEKDSVNYEILYKLYHKLGKIYFMQKNYKEAIKTLSMAKIYSNKEIINYDFIFMLAQAYQNTNESDIALKLFKEIEKTGNAFWQSLAKEKIYGIKLTNQLKKIKYIK